MIRKIISVHSALRKWTTVHSLQKQIKVLKTLCYYSDIFKLLKMYKSHQLTNEIFRFLSLTKIQRGI